MMEQDWVRTDALGRSFVAFDFGDDKIVEWVELLKAYPGVGVKIGKEAFTRRGPVLVAYIIAAGLEVFLDLKYHDIPNTVAKAGVEAAELGVKMFNLHALGGLEMMQKTVEAVNAFCKESGKRKPLILAVTVLTSLDQQKLAETLGISPESIPRQETVLHLAALARKAGCDGVVCPGTDVAPIKTFCGFEFLTYVPGTRSDGKKMNDQKQTSTPYNAILGGADMLGIGRQVTDTETKEGGLAAMEEFIGEVESAIAEKFAASVRVSA